MSDQSFTSMRTPNKSSIDFSINSTCSSVKKTLFQGNSERGTGYTAPSTYGGGDFMMQAKIEHLEKERIELTMQLHKRDEKDRDRKLKLEQMEYRLKASEEERQKAVQEASENREQVVRVKFEADELRAEITRLNQEIQNTNRIEAMDVWKKMTTASRALKKAEDDLAATSTAKDAALQQCDALNAQLSEYQTKNMHLEDELEKALEQVSALLEENKRIHQLEEQIASMNHSFNEEKNNMLDTIASLQQEQEELVRQKENLEEEMKIAIEQAKNSVTIVAQEEEESSEDIIQLRKQLFESESKRRKLHNQLQDLKGNIRVFLRCRPFLTADGEDVYQTKQTNLMLHDDKTSVTVLNPATLGTVGAKPTHQFAFDHVFTPESKQQEVYKEVSDLVQSVLDGYRVCVFSYGQTGSGKTHTMTGNRHGEERGIIPRSVEELLRNARTMQSQGWEIELSVSIVEIYNEDIRDLLAKPTPNAAFNVNNNSNKEKSEKIKIGRQNGRVVVSGLTTVPIYVGATESSYQSYDDSTAMQQFYEVFNQSMEARSTASTGMNELSSRSHLIVMIDVSATLTTVTQGTSTMTLTGGLRLCDLAGSERLDRTNTLHDATRLRETVNINKSLSCLADVFLALQNKASHVPYRNSKLTMLLQDCLSGDGKALMFVNVSPTLASSPETLCSLRFAAQVNSVELGKAQKHVQTTTVITQPAVTPALPPPPSAVSSVTATANGPTTRSRRMSVMPGMGSAARAAGVSSSNAAPVAASVVVAPPAPPAAVHSYHPTIERIVEEESPMPMPAPAQSFLSSESSTTVAANSMLMTATKEQQRSVRFDAMTMDDIDTSAAPASSMKPFSYSSSMVTSAAATMAPTPSAAVASTLTATATATATRTRTLATTTAPRRPSTLTTAPVASFTSAAATTTSTSSMVTSSLLSAAKAAKGNTDALLFSNASASTSFVINAASLSSSTGSSAAVTVKDKENIDQPQHNSFLGTTAAATTSSYLSSSMASSALLSGAKRDATALALSDYHAHSTHHSGTTAHLYPSAAAIAMATTNLSMPAKRLRPAGGGHATETGWVSSSSLSQPVQRKSTWR